MARNKLFSGYGQDLEGAATQEMTARSSNERAHLEAPTEDAIRVRAYEIYQSRGTRPGTEIDDWVAAERQLVKAARRRLQEK